MSQHNVSLHEAEGNLAELVELAGKGEDVTISCENGSIVRLVIEKPANRKRMFGMYEGKVHVSDDFDDELPDAFWLGDGNV